jgi:SH3 domain-containing YSC84-like protein 1
MLQRFIVIAMVIAGSVLPALAASDQEDDISRIHASTRVFREIMNTPDNAIPQELLESAKCVAIIPGEKKAAFIFGGNYGKGLATCRTAEGWSAPLFLAVGGGSWGLQIGGASTDIVMIIRDEHGMRSLLSDKFKIGADATVAAGPLGRQAGADTDLKMNAEILAYSRSKGVFAGISLDGAVVQADETGDWAMYGANVERKQILDGAVPVPRAAQALINEIGQYAKTHAS